MAEEPAFCRQAEISSVALLAAAHFGENLFCDSGFAGLGGVIQNLVGGLPNQASPDCVVQCGARQMKGADTVSDCCL
jgi:hypothetical protein